LATPRARLVYVDLRGHGGSDAPPDASGYTLAAASGDLSLLATRLSPRAPIDVIAHDFGAAVALEFAAAHPDQVRKLVLIAPVRDGAQIRAISARTREALGESGLLALRALTTPQGTLRDPRQLPQLFRTLGPLWWASPPSATTIETITRSVRYRPSADEHFLLQLLSWDGLRVARNVRAPTLVLSGAQDRTFLQSESRELADTIAHSRWVEVQGAGHLPFVEKPSEVVQEIESFLR
jgi:pimeloyl-ACP methyl ester carboxylesterase